MAQILNVDPQKKDDLYYRYKMPSIIVKKESRGNGVKTVFPNIRDVCAKLQRPPELLNKFFGYELGVQSTFVKADDKFLVMGAFPQEHMQDKVYDFISRVVLCKECRNPETDPRVEKGSRLLMTCRSCGKDTEVRATERIHKFMVETYEAIAKELKKQAKAKAEKGAAAAPEGGAGEDAHDPETVPDVPVPDKSRKAKIATTADQLQARNPVVELADVMRQVPPPASDKVIQTIMELKADCNVSDANTIRFVWKGTLEGVEGAKFIGTLQQWVPVLQHYSHKDKQYQTLMKEVAKSCLQYEAPHKFPMALKMLWEEGILPEAEIKEWVTTYKGKEVKDAKILQLQAAPFMAWLAGEEI